MIRRALPCLAVLALACGAGGSKSPQTEETPMTAAAPDFCSQAAELLGGTAVESCVSMLPDQYYVTVTGEPGYSGIVVVQDGVPVVDRGCAAGAAWLARIRVYDLDVKSPVALVESLAWLGALPEGFEAKHLTDHEDRTGATRFSENPFRLELRREVKRARPDDGSMGSGLGLGGSNPAPSQERAILTGDESYAFTWSLERRLQGGPWESVSTTPCVR